MAKEQVQQVAAPVQEQATKKVVEATQNIDDKDKDLLKQQAKAAASEIHKKTASVLKAAKEVLESPEANIISKAAGQKVEDKQKQG